MMEGMTKKELANIAGYTYRRLYDIDRDLPEDEKLFVPSESGKYDVAMFVQRWVKYCVGQVGGKEQSLEKVKIVHEKIKTRKTELEVKRLEGSLIDIDEIQRLWTGIAESVRKSLLHVPLISAQEISGMDDKGKIADVIEGEIRIALEAIAETPLPGIAEVPTDIEESDDEDEVEEV